MDLQTILLDEAVQKASHSRLALEIGAEDPEILADASALTELRSRHAAALLALSTIAYALATVDMVDPEDPRLLEKFKTRAADQRRWLIKLASAISGASSAAELHASIEEMRGTLQ